MATTHLTRLVVLLGSFLLASCNKIHVVTPLEAGQICDKYFQTLEAGDVPSAMAFYSSEFANLEFKSRWSRFLENKKERWGSYVSHSLLGQVIHIRTNPGDPNKTSEACFIMRYSVSYTRGKDYQTLTICPDPVDSALRIAGHKLEAEGLETMSVGLTEGAHDPRDVHSR